ncbi:hypothetical protein MMC17_000672 [Xylographa soralifera]|nr:hypothetical protein [Xylographa soralifera]
MNEDQVRLMGQEPKTGIRKALDKVIGIAQTNEEEVLSTPEAIPFKSQSSKTSFQGIWRDCIVQYWWQEMIECTIMLCALMSVLLILGLHQNRPLPDWPLAITLNSLVSVMVVIMKATMLAILASGLGQMKWLWFLRSRPLSHYTVYDKAGQGPKYASQLLWILRGRQLAACVGVIVIIVSTVLDPFTQQVIQTYVSTIPSSNGDATLPRTTAYNISGAHVGAGMSDIDHPMQGAIMAGFYSPGLNSFKVPVGGCSTGNCTFSVPYQTMGMCSICTEVTNLVAGTCVGFGPNSTAPPVCNYSLPSGTTLPAESIEGKSWITASLTSSITSPLINGSVSVLEFLINRLDLPACFAEIGGCLNTTCNGIDCGVTASDCAFYPCVQNYTAQVSNGNLTEVLLNSLPISTEHNECWTSLRKSSLMPSDWTILSNHGIHASDYPDAEFIDYCFIDGTNITKSCVYDFSENSFDGLLYFFEGGGVINNAFLNGTLQGDTPTSLLGPLDLVYLYNVGEATVASINDTFASMAQTMSSHIRVAGRPDYSTPAYGQIMVIQTLIRVQWSWLALPCSLVLLTVLVLLATIIQTGTKGRKPLGKTFSLALLLRGVAGDESDQVTDTRHIHNAGEDFHDLRESHEAIKKSADETKVRMIETKLGYRLVKV